MDGNGAQFVKILWIGLDLRQTFKASSNMLTAGAAAPAVRPPAPAVEPKFWHCGGQAMSPYLLKRSFSRWLMNDEVIGLQYLVN